MEAGCRQESILHMAPISRIITGLVQTRATWVLNYLRSVLFFFFFFLEYAFLSYSGSEKQCHYRCNPDGREVMCSVCIRTELHKMCESQKDFWFIREWRSWYLRTPITIRNNWTQQDIFLKFSNSLI